ncbi:MAG TPA: hypothetical protein VKB26_00410 [Candidatus Acidoferrales bacterium]|nr:hypothetical protein [Candidatus Acidoferrales bacterium]
MKKATAANTHKKAIVALRDKTRVHGYLNPSALGDTPTVEFLTREGEYQNLDITKVKSIHFVREFTDDHEPERKAFLSRPKLEGLWVRCQFRDGDSMEGIVPNNLVEVLNGGVRLTPPDLHGNSLWVFIPRPALAEVKVLGVVGIARRQAPAAATSSQPKLFEE